MDETIILTTREVNSADVFLYMDDATELTQHLGSNNEAVFENENIVETTRRKDHNDQAA